MKHLRATPKKITLLVLLLLLLGFFIFWWFSKANKVDSSSTSDNTTSHETASLSDDDPSRGPSEDNGLPVKDTSDTTTANDHVATSSQKSYAKITQAVQADNGDLFLKVAVYGVTAGKCQLSMAKGGQQISQSSSIYYTPDNPNVECDGFKVPASSLSDGMWDITVRVISPQGAVSPAQKRIDVQV